MGRSAHTSGMICSIRSRCTALKTLVPVLGDANRLGVPAGVYVPHSAMNSNMLSVCDSRFRVLPNGKLRLPKIGDVPINWSRPLPSGSSSVTVIKDSAGRYFASFVIETEPGALPEAEPMVGIDLGLQHFAVLSDGQKIAAPKFLRQAEKVLKGRQRELSRKQKGSRNRDKAR
jgi:putative transposase